MSNIVNLAHCVRKWNKHYLVKKQKQQKVDLDKIKQWKYLRGSNKLKLSEKSQSEIIKQNWI